MPSSVHAPLRPEPDGEDPEDPVPDAAAAADAVTVVGWEMLVVKVEGVAAELGGGAAAAVGPVRARTRGSDSGD